MVLDLTVHKVDRQFFIDTELSFRGRVHSLSDGQHFCFCSYAVQVSVFLVSITSQSAPGNLSQLSSWTDAIFLMGVKPDGILSRFLRNNKMSGKFIEFVGHAVWSSKICRIVHPAVLLYSVAMVLECLLV